MNTTISRIFEAHSHIPNPYFDVIHTYINKMSIFSILPHLFHPLLGHTIELTYGSTRESIFSPPLLHFCHSKRSRYHTRGLFYVSIPFSWANIDIYGSSIMCIFWHGLFLSPRFKDGQCLQSSRSMFCILLSYSLNGLGFAAGYYVDISISGTDIVNLSYRSFDPPAKRLNPSTNHRYIATGKSFLERFLCPPTSTYWDGPLKATSQISNVLFRRFECMLKLSSRGLGRR